MWSIQLPTGEFLDIAPDVQLSFELNNQVFSTGDTSTLPGSFSFPVDLPLTAKNRQLLGHPHLVNNANTWKDVEDVIVRAYGQALFLGTLSIRSCTGSLIRVVLLANPMAKLKNTELPQLALGGSRSVGGALDAHMDDTCRLPEDFDYVFFNVVAANDTQNYFDSSPGVGAFALDGPISPFVKLSYLLDEVFNAEVTGYKFVNEFQITTELRRLYLYNNFDARILDGSPAAPAMPTSFDLSQHVPKIKCTELLRKTAAVFCLGIFTNVWNRTIKMIPLNTLLSRDYKHDWSIYEIDGYELSNTDPAPDGFNYKQADLPPGYPEPTDLPMVFTTQEATAVTEDGFHYLECQALIFTHPVFAKPSINRHKGVYFGNKNPFDVDMEALFSNVFTYEYGSDLSTWVSDEEPTPTYKFERSDCPFLFAIYRGFNQVAALPAEKMPLACSHVYITTSNPAERNEIVTDGISEGFAERSLYWHGDYGLYQTAHRRWNEMLRTGKPVVINFSLPVTQLIEFSFEDKVRVRNMEYFVKRLRIKQLQGKGRVLVEASLVSVI